MDILILKLNKKMVMAVIKNWFLNPVLNTMSNRLLISIPEQQRKILAIALVVLGLYAIYRVVKFCRFKAEPLSEVHDRAAGKSNPSAEKSASTDARTPENSSGGGDDQDEIWSSKGKADSSEVIGDISTPFGTPTKSSSLKIPRSLHSSQDEGFQSDKGYKSLCTIFPDDFKKIKKKSC